MNTPESRADLPSFSGHFRPYAPGDEAQLVALFERVFGRAISQAHWRWKLKAQPSPAENVWVAEHDGRLVFQYAAVPTRFQLPDGMVTIMVGADAILYGRRARRCWRTWAAD